MSYRNPSPAAKFPGLVQRIRQGATSGIELTEFERRRIERDARALVRSDPVSAYTVLGALAALRGDADDARTHHENALKLSGRSMRDFTQCESRTAPAPRPHTGDRRQLRAMTARTKVRQRWDEVS